MRNENIIVYFKRKANREYQQQQQQKEDDDKEKKIERSFINALSGKVLETNKRTNFLLVYIKYIATGNLEKRRPKRSKQIYPMNEKKTNVGIYIRKLLFFFFFSSSSSLLCFV